MDNSSRKHSDLIFRNISVIKLNKGRKWHLKLMFIFQTETFVIVYAWDVTERVKKYFNFSGAKSKNLQANTAACLSSLAKGHRENQDLVVAKGAVKPLVSLAKSTKMLCQVKAASALESLATSNPEAQKEIDAADAQRPLIRLLKMWAIEVKEQGLCILITQKVRVFFLFVFCLDYLKPLFHILAGSCSWC